MCGGIERMPLELMKVDLAVVIQALIGIES